MLLTKEKKLCDHLIDHLIHDLVHLTKKGPFFKSDGMPTKNYTGDIIL